MKSKDGFKDDNRTIAPMDVDGMERPNPFGMRLPARSGKTNVQGGLKLTKGERSAIRKAAFILAVQVCVIFGAIFLGIFLFIRYVWLRGW